MLGWSAMGRSGIGYGEGVCGVTELALRYRMNVIGMKSRLRAPNRLNAPLLVVLSINTAPITVTIHIPSVPDQVCSPVIYPLFC